MESHSVAATPALHAHASSISSPTTQLTITTTTRPRSSTSTSEAAERPWSTITWAWWTPLGLEYFLSSSYRYTMRWITVVLVFVCSKCFSCSYMIRIYNVWESWIDIYQFCSMSNLLPHSSTFLFPRVLCWWACGSCRLPWRQWQEKKIQKSRQKGICWRKAWKTPSWSTLTLCWSSSCWKTMWKRALLQQEQQPQPLPQLPPKPYIMYTHGNNFYTERKSNELVKI